MQPNPISILTYDDLNHRDQVVELWQAVFNYPAEYNAPVFAIEKKLAHDDLFWVALEGGAVIGTVMAGYDGHRGWIYSMAVHPERRKQGLGTRLLDHALSVLKSMGCFKVNLQILESNEAVRRFYEANGFSTEARLSMGKRLD